MSAPRDLLAQGKPVVKLLPKLLDVSSPILVFVTETKFVQLPGRGLKFNATPGCLTVVYGGR
uniref:Uncharacterized protein n=1 Tax=Coccidioides posadasii RMSCC 3488 TaxID=454284 RepID=A0A0J6FCJ9_COCPO|nr:hypothetical protein CPAG_03356 [Coccidioides posadasii RMSCC 3488]